MMHNLLLFLNQRFILLTRQDLVSEPSEAYTRKKKYPAAGGICQNKVFVTFVTFKSFVMKPYSVLIIFVGSVFFKT